MMKSTDGADAARQPEDQAHRELAAVPEEAKRCGSFASSRAFGLLALRLGFRSLVRPHRLRRTPRLLTAGSSYSARTVTTSQRARCSCGASRYIVVRVAATRLVGRARAGMRMRR